MQLNLCEDHNCVYNKRHKTYQQAYHQTHYTKHPGFRGLPFLYVPPQDLENLYFPPAEIRKLGVR